MPYQMQFDRFGNPNEHPDDWLRIETRMLSDAEIFEVNEWLRQMALGRYDINGASRPHPHMVVFFEEKRDAVWFKLTWGGD
jgi:hypothetical protein